MAQNHLISQTKTFLAVALTAVTVVVVAIQFKPLNTGQPEALSQVVHMEAIKAVVPTVFPIVDQPRQLPRVGGHVKIATKKNYYQDEQIGTKYFNIQGGPTAMQQEMMDNGPIVACFDIYEDFYHYTTGIYHHVSGQLLGGHAVKVVGWGTENNTPYWLVINSWNQTWGLGGYFKIQRGNNECDFESQAIAGLA